MFSGCSTYGRWEPLDMRKINATPPLINLLLSRAAKCGPEDYTRNNSLAKRLHAEQKTHTHTLYADYTRVGKKNTSLKAPRATHNSVAKVK